MTYTLPLLLSSSLVLTSIAASATESTSGTPLSALQAKAVELDLAHDPLWLALLHAKSGTFHDWVSQANHPSFFLSENGKHDPAAELQATLTGLFSSNQSEKHALCRFPARAHWLQERLSIPASSLPTPDCKALNQYLSDLKPAGITLVFPVAYLNSPSSMFGHTFLRIDQQGQTETSRLMAWTVNYAANPNTEDGEVAFAWKGLFGGYPGIFSVLPYYLKVKEYNDWESRDVWEFKLNITSAETRQLVNHAWELMNVDFDYYFLTENCSYRVLELLDVVRPQYQLASQFTDWAIPVDTVRAVEDAKMVETTEFRPSAMTLVRNGLEQLSTEEREIAYSLATDSKEGFKQAQQRLTSVPTDRQNAVLEVAYEYLRLKVQLDKLNRKKTAKRSLWLLSERSKRAGPAPITPVIPPAVRDDQAHPTGRVTVGIGTSRGYRFENVSWRPAFHALSDPFKGFPTGAQIKFLDVQFRHWETDSPESFELERVDLITVTALTRHDRFFQPWSWQANVGARRQEAPNDDIARPMVGFFDFSGGITKTLTDNISAYLLGGGATEAGKSILHGFDVAPLVEIGMIGHYNEGLLPTSGQWQLSLKQLEWSNVIHDRQKVASFANGFNLDKNLALQIAFSRDKRFEHWTSESSVELAFFF